MNKGAVEEVALAAQIECNCDQRHRAPSQSVIRITDQQANPADTHFETNEVFVQIRGTFLAGASRIAAGIQRRVVSLCAEQPNAGNGLLQHCASRLRAGNGRDHGLRLHRELLFGCATLSCAIRSLFAHDRLFDSQTAARRREHRVARLERSEFLRVSLSRHLD